MPDTQANKPQVDKEWIVKVNVPGKPEVTRAFPSKAKAEAWIREQKVAEPPAFCYLAD